MKFLNYALLALVVTLFAGCGKTVATAPTTPPTPVPSSVEPTQAQPKLRTMKIYLGPTMLDAELALTEQEERTGMMFRTNIQDTDAMLFVLPYPTQANFWMKNCPESISAAYITSDGTIVEIHHLEHDDTTPVMAARNDIEFVLETQDGWFTHHNIGVGTVLRTDKGSLAETFLQRH